MSILVISSKIFIKYCREFITLVQDKTQLCHSSEEATEVVDPEVITEVVTDTWEEVIPGTWKVEEAMEQVDPEAIMGVNTDTRRKVEEDM